MTTEIAVKRCRVLGWLIVAMGILGLLGAAMFIAVACINFSIIYDSLVAIIGDESLTYAIAGVTYGILVAVIAVIAVMSIFVGHHGVKASRGEVVTKGYIVVAWILFAAQVLSSLSCLLGIIQNSSLENLSSLLVDIVWVAIIYYFIKSAKFLQTEAASAVKKKITKE